MLTSIINYFKKTKRVLVTYYIPAPPLRKSGYREKAFDQFIYHLTLAGHKLINTQMASHLGHLHSGVWIVCTFETKNEKEFLEELKSKLPSPSEGIEEVTLDL